MYSNDCFLYLEKRRGSFRTRLVLLHPTRSIHKKPLHCSLPLAHRHERSNGTCMCLCASCYTQSVFVYDVSQHRKYGPVETCAMCTLRRQKRQGYFVRQKIRRQTRHMHTLALQIIIMALTLARSSRPEVGGDNSPIRRVAFAQRVTPCHNHMCIIVQATTIRGRRFSNQLISHKHKCTAQRTTCAVRTVREDGRRDLTRENENYISSCFHQKCLHRTSVIIACVSSYKQQPNLLFTKRYFRKSFFYRTTTYSRLCSSEHTCMKILILAGFLRLGVVYSEKNWGP